MLADFNTRMTMSSMVPELPMVLIRLQMLNVPKILKMPTILRLRMAFVLPSSTMMHWVPIVLMLPMVSYHAYDA